MLPSVAVVGATGAVGEVMRQVLIERGFELRTIKFLASERSAANAHAVFRTLQAKFPNQLGGRDPIVSRTDLGTEGIYYRALVGPFASMEEAAGACATLKAAGGHCLVEIN